MRSRKIGRLRRSVKNNSMIIVDATLVNSSGSSHHIPLSVEQATEILEKIGKRVLCTVNDKVSIHCAILRSEKLGYYIMVGKATKKKIMAEADDALKLKIEKDSSTYQAEIPEELAAVLETDEEATMLFDKLTAGKKRSIIYFISRVKKSDTRITKALKVIECLKMGITDLREMK